MSDRTVVVLASAPAICGIALLGLMARAPAQTTAEYTQPVHEAADVAGEADARQGWMGVVVAENSAELAAASTGRVISVHVRTGDRVEAGQRLVQLDSSESSSSVDMAGAQVSERASEYARARARATAAEKRLERLRAGASWLSQQELDSAESERQVAVAEVRAARASLKVGRVELQRHRMRETRQTLTAPFAGTVIGLGVDTGDSVVEGQVVMRLLGDKREVRFALPPDDLDALKGQLTLRLSGAREHVISELQTVRPEVDPATQLVFATASIPEQLPQAGLWMPGATVLVAPASRQ